MSWGASGDQLQNQTHRGHARGLGNGSESSGVAGTGRCLASSSLCPACEFPEPLSVRLVQATPGPASPLYSPPLVLCFCLGLSLHQTLPKTLRPVSFLLTTQQRPHGWVGEAPGMAGASHWRGTGRDPQDLGQHHSSLWVSESIFRAQGRHFVPALPAQE